MRVSIAVLILALLSLPVRADDRADAQRLAQLVNQLGSVKFAEREAAVQQLDAIGLPALEALREAAQGQDAEVRRRAQGLVRTLERRQEAARLTAPRHLRLAYEDKPVIEAVDDIAKRTGFIIRIEGDRAALADRRVTIDTGETTFWEAFAQLCRQAGLMEQPPAPMVEKNPPRAVSSSVIMIGGGNRPIVPKDVLNPDGSDRPEVITLVSGQSPELPTEHAGAVRLQAVPPGRELADQKKGPGEALLAVEVTTEPSLRWQRVLGLRIDRAIDDQGQTLTQLPAALVKPVPPQRSTGGTVIINGVPISPDPPQAEGVVKQAPVRLRLGEKPAKLLKELTGSIAAQVRTPEEPLVTVDDILKSADRTVTGAHGSSVKVLAVKREDEGRVQLTFQVEVPAQKLDDGSAPPRPNMTVIINGRTIGQQDEVPLSAANFLLLDDKGQPFRAIKATNTGRLSGATQEFEITYLPGAGQGGPSRLVYRGRRAAIIEVPFRLENVPLP